MSRSLSTAAPSSVTATSTVFVVDDDNGLRDAIEGLLQSVGHEVRTFRSAEEFLRSCDPSEPGCLVLDVRLPETSGLELQKRLVALDYRIPIVFISGHGDVPMTVQAMKSGAIDFLLKPFREQDLLETIQAALRRDRIQRDEVFRAHKDLANARSLTAREREIMQHVVTGEINKQIAFTLGLSEVTVKIHRAQVMRKMGASSLADLVRIADKLKALS
jgi:FixJ family two-component response regulator